EESFSKHRRKALSEFETGMEFLGRLSPATEAFFDRHVATFGKLEAMFPTRYIDTFSCPYQAYEAAKAVRTAIDQQQPYSLLRLSDGEGRFLTYPDDLKFLMRPDQLHIQSIWWGATPLGSEDEVVQRFRRAVDHADAIGISDWVRLVSQFRFHGSKKNIYFSAQRGALGANCYVAERGSEELWKEKMLLSCIIHHHWESWGLYEYLFASTKKVSLITCHSELPQLLQKRFGLRTRLVLKIPPEFCYAGSVGLHGGTPQYPERYEEICQEIHVESPGEVFLVGAGFLGKIYCDLIKSQGGIGLDVGSIVDLWLDHNVRPEMRYQGQRMDESIFHIFDQFDSPEK
ncbi:MAG: hypothetical protein AAGA96_20160, partial [Verrucomicrobiota bacterium]